MTTIIQKEELSFNVSARTARLIGRENVASAEGAIIELVKNTYDADSDFCIVYFDIPYQSAPDYLSKKDFIKVNRKFNRYNIELNDFYIENNKNFQRKIESLENKELSDKTRYLDKLFNSLTNVYIIDNGDGMNANTIKKYWMTIGTDDKVHNHLSSKNRVKSGAKGIGRFALDRLGEICYLWSKKKNSTGLEWTVDWEIFEQNNKTINEIKASLEHKDIDLAFLIDQIFTEEQFEALEQVLSNRTNPLKLKSEFGHGTIIKVSYMRDDWDESSLLKIYTGLETLVPPTEDDSFQLFLFNNRFTHPKLNGQVLPILCDNFDYKLSAEIANGKVWIEIERNEFQLNKIPQECIQNYFPGGLKEKSEYSVKLESLLPGSSENKDIKLSNIGDFKFIIYFLKKITSKKDSQKYFQKEFDYAERGQWLDYNSGIKIFRDYFRVRPYGELDSTSWDWLGLGNRVALNPAAVSRKGQWRVSPKNLAGIINISRISNTFLEDKSNREGLQENIVFNQFKEIILAIIKIFEDDRSSVYSALDKYSKDMAKFPEDEDLSNKEKQRAHNTANKIFLEFKEKQKETGKSDKSTTELLSLSLLKEQSDKDDAIRELADMKEENSLLRVFASSGITIASFAHELRNLEMKLKGNRYSFIEEILQQYIDPTSFEENEDFDNPYYLLELIEKEDSKMRNWLQYTLRTIKKDKRTRKSIDLIQYLFALKQNWSLTLDDRHINFNIISKIDSYSIRAFEIDFDCIFNNLIINSCEAFDRPNYISRNILIEVDLSSEGLVVLYSDEGPGLSEDIADAKDIFKSAFSTKRDKNGKQIGTGLGMWLIKKTLEEYKAEISIMDKKQGFGVRMIFPNSAKKDNN
ncbi:sensor histidine kinase [Gilliamella sp. B2824]|uniref:ATP-binding protein n=1 Tax=Gilliamella sp. B2824 TaxID=2818019 RepID=UPI002269BE42|nr:HAMP domain-containing sensor histidine kinase [Gilliamella sp. B2824]MCX8737763.1 sensor histidine kinase [Gilliamella sp. B2824]